jgi:Ca-activated chloride channel family protein
VDPGASINVAWDGGDVTGYGEGRFVVPAGELRLTARIGTGELRETLNLAPSSVTERDLVLAIGRVAANAFYTAGGEKVTAPGLAIEVASARKRLDGGRESFGTLYGPDQGFDLVPGDYVLVARLDAVMVEVPFTVRAGELTEVAAILDAGVLAASAPGAYSIEIVAARPDLQGSRVSFGLTYGESAQLTLPGGDYLVLARMTAEGPTKEAAATVRPGERTEATLP